MKTNRVQSYVKFTSVSRALGSQGPLRPLGQLGPFGLLACLDHLILQITFNFNLTSFVMISNLLFSSITLMFQVKPLFLVFFIPEFVFVCFAKSSVHFFHLHQTFTFLYFLLSTLFLFFHKSE